LQNCALHGGASETNGCRAKAGIERPNTRIEFWASLAHCPFMHSHENDMDELMSCRLDHTRKTVEPCCIVIFGASGDLTIRKLIPALYHLFKARQMPAEFCIIGFARREKTDESWRAELREGLEQFSRSKPVDDAVCSRRTSITAGATSANRRLTSNWRR
jgi:hypothetical protein